MRALGKNPLIRRSDRVEALAVMLAVVAAVLIVPIFAVDAGRDTYSAGLRAATEQAHTRFPIEAIALSDSAAKVDPATVTAVNVRWTAGGAVHTDLIWPSHSVNAGDRLPIWVDAQGNRVSPPTTPSSAAGYAVTVGVAIWLAAVFICGVLIAAMHRLLDRRRLRAWSSELDVLLNNGGGKANFGR
jgi:hypothetical protein